MNAPGVRLANRLIGQPVARVEDERFLRGAGCYVGDLRPENLLHAAFLRSPVAHGRIRRLDAAAALGLAGVHSVLTARDLGEAPRIPVRQEALPGMQNFIQPVLASDRVRYVGEPIAVVLAETQGIAEDALALIELEVEELPAVTDCRSAATEETLLHEAAGTNLALELDAVRGDADPVFAAAPYTRRERFSVQRHTAFRWSRAGCWLTGMRAALIALRRGQGCVPEPATLAATDGARAALGDAVENDNGGGFGVRGEFYPEDFLYRSRRGGADGQFDGWKTGGKIYWPPTIRARRLRTGDRLYAGWRNPGAAGTAWCDTGAYLGTAGGTAARNVTQVMSGPYRIPDVHMRAKVFVTNKTPVGTYRGPGRFEADFCRERLLDIVAGELGLDRVAFRRRNLLRPEEHPWELATLRQMEMGTETDGGDYAETLQHCLDRFGWEEKLEKLSGRLIEGRWHGIAIGSYIEGGASGPREHVRLELEPSGKVAVHCGSSSIGQGVETVFTQIAADALELPMAAIAGVFHGSTVKLQDGFGSYSSRSTVLGGSAILNAAEKLRAAWAGAAAARLGCSAAQVLQDADRLSGPDGQVVTLAELAEDGLAADGVFASSKRTYWYGSHAAAVSVDPATGEVRVLDYVAVEDVGRAINPATLHGQTLGSVVQGLGGALLEHLVYDERGQMLTTSLADYLMPTAPELPTIQAVVLDNHPSPNNPLGAKGAGEGGIIPVGALVANAVADALQAFGVQPNDLPLSPVTVWGLLRAAA